MTWAEAKERCPPGVVPACHNSLDTITISGPEEAVAKFVDELKAEGTFAKMVNSAGVAFHSYYMADTAPALRAALDKVGTVCTSLPTPQAITNPKEHSARLIGGLQFGRKSDNNQNSII